MKIDNKKALYESIMSAVAKEVKKALNEDQYSDAMKEMEAIEKEMQDHRREMYKREMGITSDENIKKAQNAFMRYQHKEITADQLNKYLESLKG